MALNRENIFVVSFHDLAPYSQAVCDDILRDLREVGIDRVSLLLTPKWHDGETIDRFPDFLEWVRAQELAGHEICLHGFTHRAPAVSGGLVSQAMGRVYTAGEGEFYQLSLEEARERIHQGSALLRLAGLSFQGFVAPAWLLSEPARQALVEEGFLYTTYLQHFDLLQADRKIFAPTLVYSSRSGWRRLTSIGWVKLWERIHRDKPVMRLAIHPLDWRYPTVREAILQMARRLRQSRTPITYRDLVQRYA